MLAERTRRRRSKLATVFLSIHPTARLAHLQSFLNARLPQSDLSETELWDLFLSYSPERLTGGSRLCRRRPSARIVARRILQQHPAPRGTRSSRPAPRSAQEAYSWLFKGNPHKQDTRIRILLEQDAFSRIHENWKSLGYPFSHLVPSLGSAIGASGDRPDALAELMGTVMNGGVRVPTVTIENLRFAENTPYDTSLSPSTQPQRVMPPEVAATVKRALTGVVASGTAARLNGTYVAANGTPLAIGGKTGTGDNRFERYGRGGALISSRVVDRTATFVFYLGERFFGTVTAYAGAGCGALPFHQRNRGATAEGAQARARTADQGQGAGPAGAARFLAGARRSEKGGRPFRKPSPWGGAGCASPSLPPDYCKPAKRSGAISVIPAISLTSLRVIASAKLWKS